MKTCAACSVTALQNDYLECIRCVEAYHYLCLNYSAEEVSCMDNDAKTNWMCPNCRSKQPKGDNSNTLVRPSTPTGLAEATFNITRRKVQNVMTSSQNNDFVTRSDIQIIIREEMRAVMREFSNEINGNLNMRLRELNDQMTEFKDSLGFLSEQFDTLKTHIDDQGSKIKQLETENKSLRSDVQSLSNRVRQMDQLSRSANLEVQCVSEHRSENVVTIIKQLCNVVKYPIGDGDIAYCSRIAKTNPSSARPRSILVRFSNPRTRDSILAASIQYNKDHKNEKLNSSLLGLDDKKTPIYVVENLTVENKSLHAAARLRAKQLNYKYVWVRGGRVYVRKSDTSEAVFVRDMDVVHHLK